MTLSPGDRVDRYEVIELLGSGGMGEVYRARDPKLERLVAVKILHVDRRAGTVGAARLLREARAAAALSHPNVLAVYDVGEVSEPASLRGLAYIAMELVIGKSLRAHVGDPGVPIERRIGWMRDAGLALAAAHEAGVVHRDVKPENVMIRADGVVKVLDFGIAQRMSVPSLDPEDSSGAHDPAALPKELPAVSRVVTTTQGALVGTPFYMAPEQLRGEPLDGRADQFSWGVVAYELLTGAPPWDADVLVIGSQILSLNPPPPAEVDPRIPGFVSDAVLRALAKRPVDRFPSMTALIANLEAGNAPKIEIAPPPSTALPGEPAVPPVVEASVPPPRSERSKARAVHARASALESERRRTNQVVDVDSDHAVGTLHNLLVIVWRDETHPEAVARASTTLQALVARYPEGVGLMQVAEVSAKPPEAAARTAVAKMLSDGKGHVVCSSLVFSGTGFRMAAARSLATGLTILSRPGFPHVVFSSVAEAAEWHGRLLGSERTNREAIETFVEGLRRAIDLQGAQGG